MVKMSYVDYNWKGWTGKNPPKFNEKKVANRDHQKFNVLAVG